MTGRKTEIQRLERYGNPAIFFHWVLARTGGAQIMPGVIRVTFWSALAMAVTAGVGALFGAVA